MSVLRVEILYSRNKGLMEVSAGGQELDIGHIQNKPIEEVVCSFQWPGWGGPDP